MTRFGVMKHLKQLEEAGPRRDQAARPGEAPLPEPGPDPARPRPVGEQVRRALGRRRSAISSTRLERPMEKVFEIYIRTTPERLWEAITDPETRSKYHFGAGVHSDWTPGSPLEMAPPGGRSLGEGEVLEVDPPAPAGPHHGRALERRREERGYLPGHLGDRARRRLLPPDA